MKKTSILALILAVKLSVLHADEPCAAIAAALIADNQEALVDIIASVRIKPEVIDGPPGFGDMLAQQPVQEKRAESKGVVIHSSGLVVAPLITVDPVAMVGDGIDVDTPMGKLKLALRATISSINIITADGREYSADLVLRENAAGLALFKLSTPPEGGLKAVALQRDLPVPQPFSALFDLVRLGAEFNRAPAVRALRMVQSTTPPIPLFEVTGTPLPTPGSAAFDSVGNFRGISVLPIRSQGASGGRESVISVVENGLCILPTSEILRICAKALALSSTP